MTLITDGFIHFLWEHFPPKAEIFCYKNISNLGIIWINNNFKKTITKCNFAISLNKTKQNMIVIKKKKIYTSFQNFVSTKWIRFLANTALYMTERIFLPNWVIWQFWIKIRFCSLSIYLPICFLHTKLVSKELRQLNYCNLINNDTLLLWHVHTVPSQLFPMRCKGNSPIIPINSKFTEGNSPIIPFYGKVTEVNSLIISTYSLLK